MEGESMSEWKEKKLYEVCQKITDGSHYSPVAVIKGYPMLSVKDMREYDFDFSSCKNISNEDFCKMRQNDCIPQVGDVLVAKDGSYLKEIFCCKEYRDIAILSSIAIFRPNQNIISPDFLCYLLKTPFIFNYISKNCVSGSALPRIVLKSFKDVCIPVPDLFTQSEIAGILSSLDAKIETNNKLNEKLEEMAQAIFKSWFVDFEPFKDKPFHETEIGYIPQIFESGVLGDLCTFKRGKGLLSKDAIFGNVPVIAGGMKPACYHNIANTKAPVVTVSGSGANAGYTQIHNVDVWASDCSFIDSNCENLYYVYCFLSRRPKLLRHSQTGAAQPHVKPADIHRFQVVIPTKDVINEFQQIVKPLFDRIGMNKKENDRLASLRDTLLPRLMSGELIV